METESTLLDLLSKYREDFLRAKTGLFLSPQIGSALNFESVIEYRADGKKHWEARKVKILSDKEPVTSVVLMHATKDVDETLGGVGMLASRGAEEIIFICSNDRGASRYQKIFAADLRGEPLSKFHHKVLKIKVSDNVRKYAAHAIAKLSEDNLFGVAGTFSAHGIDKGSKLLAECLPKLRGSGADLCAGNGYLTLEALKRGASKVTMVEIDARSLRAAALNLERDGLIGATESVWSDLFDFEPKERFEWIVMNPPFHNAQGRQERKLGERCIVKAATLLKPKAPLIVVSLTTNAYQGILKENFSEVKVIGSDKTFSVYQATNRQKDDSSR